MLLLYTRLASRLVTGTLTKKLFTRSDKELSSNIFHFPSGRRFWLWPMWIQNVQSAFCLQLSIKVFLWFQHTIISKFALLYTGLGLAITAVLQITWQDDSEFLNVAIMQYHHYKTCLRICARFGLMNAKQEKLAFFYLFCHKSTKFFKFTCFYGAVQNYWSANPEYAKNALLESQTLTKAVYQYQ